MKVINSIFIFSIALILTIIFFEALLSFCGMMIPIIKIDSNVGERYIPNKMCCSISVSEGFGLAKTNSEGWFGKKFVDNGLSDISIAVIGNSYVSSRQVFYRDNFLSISEELTNKNLNKTIASYFNFGRQAMPLTELLFIKEEISSIHNPDYILILLNAHSFNTTSRQVPYYKLMGDSLVLDSTFKESPMLRTYRKLQIFSNSSVFFLGYRVKNKLPQLWKILFDKFYPSEEEPEQNNDPIFSLSDVNKVILEKLESDKKVIFLLDLDYDVSNKVKTITTQSQIIDLRPTLLKMKTEQGIDPNYWAIEKLPGHWNIPAHKVIGEEIANNMIKIINNNQITRHNEGFMP